MYNYGNDITPMEMKRFTLALEQSNVYTLLILNDKNVLIGTVLMYANGRRKNYACVTLFHSKLYWRAYGRSNDANKKASENVVYATGMAIENMVNMLKEEVKDTVEWNDEEAINTIRNIDINDMKAKNTGYHILKDIGFKLQYVIGCWNPGRWCTDETINR